MTKGLVAIASVLTTSAAMAANLNLTVRQVGGTSNITVAPNAVVNYEVVGTLTSTVDNKGLALFGFDLDFSGPAPLTPAATPTTVPMNHFAIPLGISNPPGPPPPTGYGGTVIGGNLIQCGGGQNTIKNTLATADYPIADPIQLNVAHSAQVLLTGSLTAPAAVGPYTLAILNPFANVINATTTGTPFWKTEQAGMGSVTNLSITVGGCSAAIVSTDPPSNAIDARQDHPVNNLSPAQGFQAITVNFSCSPLAAVVPADFTVTEVPPSGGVPTIAVAPVDSDTVMLNLSTPIERGRWTVITHNASGTKTCLALLPGDVNDSRATNAQDITSLINHLNNVPGQIRPLYKVDINRSNAVNAQDITSLVNILNGADQYSDPPLPTLPASPCP